MGVGQPDYLRDQTSAARRQCGRRTSGLPLGLCQAATWTWAHWAAWAFAALALCPASAGAAESASLIVRVVVLPHTAVPAPPALKEFPLPVLNVPLTNAPLALLPASEVPLRMVLTVASAAASGHPHFTTQGRATLPYGLSLGGIPLRFPSGGSLSVVPSRAGGLLTLSTSGSIPPDARDTVALTFRVN